MSKPDPKTIDERFDHLENMVGKVIQMIPNAAKEAFVEPPPFMRDLHIMAAQCSDGRIEHEVRK